MRRQGGFTIIELIVVIVIAGILATMIASFITGPIQGAVQQDARAALVDQADVALQRMGREIHAAVPNSVRVPSSGAQNRLEMIGVLEGASYRLRPGNNPSGVSHNQPSDRLNTDTDDASFNILGRFDAAALAPPATLSNGERIVIYPTDPDQLYQDAAANDPSQELVITPASDGSFQISLADDSDETQIQLGTPFDFAYGSPRQRLYLTDTVRSFVCDNTNGQLVMYWGYTIQGSQPNRAALEGFVSSGSASRAILARNVTGCSFAYAPGTAERAGLVTINLTLSTPRAGVVELLQQVHVVNTP